MWHWQVVRVLGKQPLSFQNTCTNYTYMDSILMSSIPYLCHALRLRFWMWAQIKDPKLRIKILSLPYTQLVSSDLIQTLTSPSQIHGKSNLSNNKKIKRITNLWNLKPWNWWKSGLQELIQRWYIWHEKNYCYEHRPWSSLASLICRITKLSIWIM